jgi:predicted aconitase
LNFKIPGKGSFKLDEEMVAGFQAGYDMLMKHGWLPWLSMQSLFEHPHPQDGRICGQLESSAACYINTILGARTNREAAVNTGVTALTPAACPSTALISMSFRAGQVHRRIDGRGPRQHHKGMADWGALGAAIAEKAGNRIMAVLNLPRRWARARPRT